jgi:4-hydroxy-4-methyl-2-oxoglutarate aldolase
MPITINPFDAEIISDEELALWKTVPSAVACDAMNRTNGMIADIQSLVPDTILAGQALTVHAPNGTNAPLHHAVKCALPGCILVIDAKNLRDKAVWGSVVNAYALTCGVRGLIFDGCVRDTALLKQSDMPIFCRGSAPNGPTKEEVGGVNIPITCGGVTVHPGDIIIGDDDGIAVIPFKTRQPVLEKCQARMAEKEDWKKKTQDGVSTAELWKLTPPKS